MIDCDRSALISDCGTYRYRLDRLTIAHDVTGKTAAFIMVNPSTADAVVDDPTIRKVEGFVIRNGAGRFVVGNLFAFRATDIKALRTAAYPVGPENDRHLEQIMRDADLHIVAWGPLAKLPPHLRDRWREVVAIADQVGCRLMCLTAAQDGHPRHPLMLSYSTPLVAWSIPGGAHAQG
ncbi:hypothetical protein AA309_12925 [Microvirga vignae]|uniref:DUF1643 domain-containing protein n=1 Tax=Microvirga vignae TaxID=1225564 RepID=A0A0H1RC25_9HYPH|nr:DUF1643 domain-containing protein [Microvirga vignae]KLK92604.1 hypothetical protein AA309_12925 [Microvirga vignae]